METVVSVEVDLPLHCYLSQLLNVITFIRTVTMVHFNAFIYVD